MKAGDKVIIGGVALACQAPQLDKDRKPTCTGCYWLKNGQLYTCTARFMTGCCGFNDIDSIIFVLPPK